MNLKKPGRLLRSARIAAGFSSVPEAARHFGWVESTLRHHENGTRNISRKAARKYQEAFSISATALLTEDDDIPGIVQVRSVPVVGEVSMGVWYEPSAQRAVGLGRVSTVCENGEDAVLVSDNSVDLFISPGEYAIFAPFSGDLGDLSARALVLVKRSRGDMVEQSIWRLEKNGGAYQLELHSRSNRSATIRLLGTADDDIEVVGIVTGKFTPYDPD